MKKNYSYIYNIGAIAIFVALIMFSSASAATVNQNQQNQANQPQGPMKQECTKEMQERDKLKGQVDSMSAQLESFNQANSYISKEVARYRKLLNVATTTTGIATSTPVRATSTATSTASSTIPQSVGSSSFSIGVSPSTVNPGGSFTFSMNINSTSIKKYSVHVYQGNSLVGTLISGATVDGSSRPVYVERVFQISSSIPLGTYSVKVVDDNNSTVSQSTNLFIASGNGFTTNNSNAAVHTTTTVQSGNSNVNFSNPFKYAIVPRNKNVQITWTAQSSSASTMNLSLHTTCMRNVPVCTQYSPNNPTSSCVTIASSCKGASKVVPIASNVPVSGSSVSWTIPSNVVDSVGVIVAEQNGQRIGTGEQFYISY